MGTASLKESFKSSLRPSTSRPRGDRSNEFAEYRPPTEEQLRAAANLELQDEDGNTIFFGEFYPDWPGALATNPHGGLVYPTADNRNPKTVVFFIRGLLCGQCQDYMTTAVSRLDPDEIAASNVRVVIITNGSWKGIKKYSELVGSKFKIYTDPDLAVYRTLGYVNQVEPAKTE
jgi:peroxiredoxin